MTATGRNKSCSAAQLPSVPSFSRMSTFVSATIYLTTGHPKRSDERVVVFSVRWPQDRIGVDGLHEPQGFGQNIVILGLGRRQR
jgi:hypothetical protein